MDYMWSVDEDQYPKPTEAASVTKSGRWAKPPGGVGAAASSSSGYQAPPEPQVFRPAAPPVPPGQGGSGSSSTNAPKESSTPPAGHGGGSVPAAHAPPPPKAFPIPKVNLGAVRPPTSTLEERPRKKAVPPSFTLEPAPESGDGSGQAHEAAADLPDGYWDQDKDPLKVWTEAPTLVTQEGEQGVGEPVDAVMETPMGC